MYKITTDVFTELVIIQALLSVFSFFSEANLNITFLAIISIIGFIICASSLSNFVGGSFAVLLSGGLFLLLCFWFLCFAKSDNPESITSHLLKIGLGHEKLNIWGLSILLMTCLVIDLSGNSYIRIRFYWYIIVILLNSFFCFQINKNRLK